MYLSCKSDNTTSSATASETSTTDKDPFTKAFNLHTREIHNDLFILGKAFCLRYLPARYTSLLGENIDTSSYRTEELQNKLKSHYGDRIVIQSQRGQSKSSIIFSSSITVGQAITAATALKETVTDMAGYYSGDDSDSEESDSSRDTNTLYHSAKGALSVHF